MGAFYLFFLDIKNSNVVLGRNLWTN